MKIQQLVRPTTLLESMSITLEPDTALYQHIIDKFSVVNGQLSLNDLPNSVQSIGDMDSIASHLNAQYRMIYIARSNGLKDLNTLPQNVGYVEVSVRECMELTNIDGLPNNIRSLELSRIPKLTNIDKVLARSGGLTNLQVMLVGLTSIDLSNNSELQDVYLSCRDIRSIKGIKNLDKLENVSIMSGTIDVGDLDGLRCKKFNLKTPNVNGDFNNITVVCDGISINATTFRKHVDGILKIDGLKDIIIHGDIELHKAVSDVWNDQTSSIRARMMKIIQIASE